MLNIERYKGEIAKKMKTRYLGVSLIDTFYKHCEDYGPNMTEPDILNWLLSEAPILTEKEKKYLQGVIAPFKDRVIYIKKVKFNIENEHICIYVKGPESYTPIAMVFPNFEVGTMYKDMELNKKYNLEELGL